MFEYWKKIDSLHHHNRLLLAFTALLGLIVFALVFALIQTPKRYEFWLSPAMTINGGLVKADDIPNEYVQGFVSTLLPTILSWSSKGPEEFSNNIKHFHYYFSERHRKLLNDTLRAYTTGQLFNRTQIASLYRFMEPGDIKKIGLNTWEVKLVLRITQRLNNSNAMVIADKVVADHIRVVKLRLSKLKNPFQLALDGYTKPERRLKDLLEHEENQNEKT